MSERKIFAGPRIRRIRNERNLTQTAMAEALGISPSYLNLIERNQRPLTVQLLLKLTSVYQLDINQLQGESGTTVAALKEVFSDPLLIAELPGDQELIEIGEAAPNAALGVMKLYRAYKEQRQRLSDLSDMLAKDGRATLLTAARLPFDEVQDVLARHPYYYASLEEEAEAFLKVLNAGDDLQGALKNWLRSEQGITVRTLPVDTMPDWRRRYDRHSQRLFISERLSLTDQVQEIASEAAMLRMQVAIHAEADALKLSSREARRLMVQELARYAARALLMPYRHFRETAKRVHYDIDVLAARFRVSFQQAANRLVSLQKAGASGLPFFLMETDHAGNIFRALGAQGFPHSGFGGQCPKLGLFTSFSRTGQIITDMTEMPDQSRYLTISRTVEAMQAGFEERPRRTALLLGVPAHESEEIIYRRGIVASQVLTVGKACRLCERQGCISRAEPPLTRPLALDESVSGLSAFDFQ
ncbi:short-chain fatty acyl-CoA regulator family protein [Brucellaceae bacterium C25G]